MQEAAKCEVPISDTDSFATGCARPGQFGSREILKTIQSAAHFTIYLQKGSLLS